MNLLDAYKYLYYRIYAWQLWAWGADRQPALNAFLIVTIFVYLNLLSIFFAFEALTGSGVLNQLGSIHALTAGAVIGIVNYFIFLYRDKYRQIAKRFEKENEADKRRRLTWCWVYIILIHVCFFGSLLLLPVNMNN